MTQDFYATLVDCARAEGFPITGALDIDLAHDAIAPHVARYDQWITAGHAETMTYLVRGRERRADPRKVMSDAQSILCVALPYSTLASGGETPAIGPRYARYIRGRDYHDEIAEMLERAMVRVREKTGSEGLRWKVCVDTSAVLERSWAALAGLGWLGKNTLLIHPQHGSYLLLGEVLINRATGRGPQPLQDYCGNCDRCLKACPTSALTEARWLESSRCISYSTLERRGSLTDLNEETRRAAGTWIAGCDLCQEVCPFNAKAVKKESVGAIMDGGAEKLSDWVGLLLETPDEYKRRVAGSALSRVKPAQFSRNLAMTLTQALPKIAGVNGVGLQLRTLVKSRLDIETDPDALAEWQTCLNALDTARAPS